MPGFCPKCFSGTLRGDIVPTGTEEKIHGLDVYVARPPKGKKALGLIIILADVFGWTTPNVRGLADSYARRGPFLVYVPDFTFGNPANPEYFTLLDGIRSTAPDWYTALVMKPWWVWRILTDLVPFGWRHRQAVAKPRIFDFFSAVRRGPPPPELDRQQEEAESFKVGAVGFCWGGKYTVLLAQDVPSSRVELSSPPRQPNGLKVVEGKQEGTATPSPTLLPLIDYAFTAHPSLLTIPADVRDVRAPLSVANGEDDEWMGAEGMRTLTKELEGHGGRHEVVVYPGAVHGFAIRGDPKDERQAEMGLKAEDQAVGWFTRHFGGEGGGG